MPVVDRFEIGIALITVMASVPIAEPRQTECSCEIVFGVRAKNVHIQGLKSIC